MFTNYANTSETLASEVAQGVATELRRILNDSDEATIEELADRLEDLAENYDLLASGYWADEEASESKRWAQCEIDMQEGRTEGWADLEDVIQRAFRHYGPSSEQCCPWRRTLEEPWRSIAELMPLLPPALVV